MAITVTEETLEQEVAAILGELLPCKYITQGRIGGQFDVLLFYKGFKFVLELEIGKPFTKIPEAIKQAYDYKERLGADGILALVYPPDARSVVATQDDVRSIALKQHVAAMFLLPFLKDLHWEIPIREAARLVREGARARRPAVSVRLLVSALKSSVQGLSLELRRRLGVATPVLQEVIGSFELFQAMAGEGAEPLDDESLKAAAADLASYIIVNQILLYYILSKQLRRRRLPGLALVSSPRDLEEYFRAIKRIDYRAVYSVDVASNLGAFATGAVNSIITALHAIEPEHLKHDLLGRFFHDFLPSETRKLLAAFYTKPVAAELLAALAVRGGEKACWTQHVGAGLCWLPRIIGSARSRLVDGIRLSSSKTFPVST